MRVLQMLQDQKISVEEGLELLKALETPIAEHELNVVQHKPKWFRIRVTESGKIEPKIMVNIPMGLVDWVLNAGRKFASLGGVDLDGMGVDLDQLKAALAQGSQGKIIDAIDDQRGERVEIYIK